MLDRKIEIEGSKYNGRTYREVLINEDALKATLGEDASDGIDLQKIGILFHLLEIQTLD